MRNSLGEGGEQKLAKRKPDSAGYVHSPRGLVNDPARIRRLENRSMLASSLPGVSRQAASANSTMGSLAAASLIDKARSPWRSSRARAGS